MRVLTSFPRPRATTNPYITQLAEALSREPDVDVCYFSWRTALVGRYDVVHAHWPEVWLQGRTTPRRVVRVALVALLCLRLWVTRTPVVRTWHNLELPRGLWRVDYLLLAFLDRLTRIRIRLNEFTEMPHDKPYVTIPHGHYREWFSRFPRQERVPGLVAFVGRIRRYKGVEHLIEVFRQLPGDDVSLSVAGLPSSDELVTVISSMSDGDPRVEVTFEYVDEASYVKQVTRSSCVVLPYRHMHNSGTVLAALSLDRPVLVPDNEVNRGLADEVGTGWIHLYRGDLTAADLSTALVELRSGPVGSPDLSRRGWDEAGRMHVEVYRRAVGRPGAVSTRRSSRP